MNEYEIISADDRRHLGTFYSPVDSIHDLWDIVAEYFNHYFIIRRNRNVIL